MACVDADYRRNREAAFMYEAQECAVASDTGQDVGFVGILFEQLKPEFIQKQCNFPESPALIILEIGECVYLHFKCSVCYNMLS